MLFMLVDLFALANDDIIDVIKLSNNYISVLDINDVAIVILKYN